MNFIRQTQKNSSSGCSPKRIFPLTHARKFAPLSSLSCTVHCLFSRGDAQVRSHPSHLLLQQASPLRTIQSCPLPATVLEDMHATIWETLMATFGLIAYQDAP